MNANGNKKGVERMSKTYRVTRAGFVTMTDGGRCPFRVGDRMTAAVWRAVAVWGTVETVGE